MRKFLSLLLALIMTMSLVTIGAGATDFTDDDSITYQEAIDVISAIGVVDGYSDGSFKPTAVLTRGAAAKIITNMILGPTTSGSLTATAAPFKDVPANHTFAPQISYCAQHKIINGYSDGTFKPGATLTGYAFLKMLLGALGYDGEIEHFTGANWTINVAKLANGAGLLSDLSGDFAGTASVDRQTACLFAFNTLKADLVEYDSKITANVGGVDVTIGGSNGAKSVTSESQATTTNNWNIINESRQLSSESANHDNYAVIQFGEQYFPRLVRNEGYFRFNDRWNSRYCMDDLGRPASTWTYRGEKIGTYNETPIKTYEGNVSITTIYNDLEMNTATNGGINGIGTIVVNGEPFGGLTYNKSSKEVTAVADGTVDVKRMSQLKVNDFTAGFDFWVANGKFSATNSNAFDVTQDMLDDVEDGVYDGPTDKKVGNGTIVEVYRNDKTNDVIIAVISVYGGKITALREGTAKRDDYVEIEYGDKSTSWPVGIEDNNWYETTGLKEDDVVAYTYSNKSNSIQSMKKIDSVEGSLARRTVEKDVTLGDTTYKYAKEYNFEYGLNEDQLTNRSNYRLFLDDYGYALWIEEAEFNVKDYAVIERITSEVKGSRNSIVTHTLDDLAGNYDSGYTGTGEAIAYARGPQTYDSTSTVLDWTTNRAQLLFADGSEKTVNLDRSYATTDTSASLRYFSRPTFKSGTDITVAGTNSLEFWAGDIVRVSEVNGSYRLNKVSQADLRSWNSSSSNNTNLFLSVFGGEKQANESGTTGFATISDRELKFDGKHVNTDSNTVFVVKIDNGHGSYEWKVFTGVRNAPTVREGTGFAYMRGNVAKVVFITDGTVMNVSRDVTFITGASVSKLRTEADGRQYYTYDAVVRGEITTIKVDADIESNTVGGKPAKRTGATAPKGKDFTIGKGTDEEDGSVMIINNYISDVDDVITVLEYSDGVAVGVDQGIRKVSGKTDEIRIGARGGNSGSIMPVASNVKVFLSDNGGSIEEIKMEDVITNRDNWVYYTLDDGEITSLFIVEVADRD